MVGLVTPKKWNNNEVVLEIVINQINNHDMNMHDLPNEILHFLMYLNVQI
jgi:hypothetical protein